MRARPAAFASIVYVLSLLACLIASGTAARCCPFYFFPAAAAASTYYYDCCCCAYYCYYYLELALPDLPAFGLPDHDDSTARRSKIVCGDFSV
ncbi:hypothetical protein AOQ84DRAFT_356140 [Glonium stellatum]|uniref:Secreted peptide n=1 Tax=Glonium stellatum TaxID=574774 RepID=A0A8E2EUG8_9PEZI|nr:hypothetical protein AOQ84DRAFT_356140 [Glonium stellatum]